jgi:hypothetical protein
MQLQFFNAQLYTLFTMHWPFNNISKNGTYSASICTTIHQKPPIPAGERHPLFLTAQVYLILGSKFAKNIAFNPRCLAQLKGSYW